MSINKYDYLIIGAGILGSAVAYHLSKKSDSIAVVDVDLDGEYSSTLKNAGGVRATWRNSSNIQLCNYSIKFYETISDKISFKQKGYYWLHNKHSLKEIEDNLENYNAHGLDIELVEKKDVSKILPFIRNLDEVEGLSISKSAGIIDHYSLREYYRRHARERGVKFFDRQFVYDVDVENKNAIKVYTRDFTESVKRKGSGYIKEILEEDTVDSVLEQEYKIKNLINCTGAWSARLSELFGYHEDRNKPRRRQIELINCPEIDLSEYGMVIDTSDIYFHQEGQNILVGYSNKDEPYGVNFNFDFFSYDENSPFVEYIWKPLVKRNTAFKNIRFIRGWAGVYGETPDRSGYIGNVPGFGNIFECVGHTGRGLMISYGAAKSLVDIMTKNRLSEDLSFASSLHRTRPSGPQYEELHL